MRIRADHVVWDWNGTLFADNDAVLAAVNRVCADFGVKAGRVEGESGTWVAADERGPRRKIGAIGIRVSRQVAMHGFALNCDPDLAFFDTFVPCGIADAGVTSLSQEIGRDVTVDEVLPIVEKHIHVLTDVEVFS